MGRRPLGLENSAGAVRRAGVKAEGRNVVPTDHEGRISRYHGPQVLGNPIPIRGISDQIMEIGPPTVER